MNTPKIKRLKRQNLAAFTLIEIVVTLAILGIIAAIAVPSGIDAVRNQRLNTATKTVISMLDYARSDAVIAKTDITICAYNEADNSICPLTADWSNGIKLMRGQFKVYKGGGVKPIAPTKPAAFVPRSDGFQRKGGGDIPLQEDVYNLMSQITCDKNGSSKVFPSFRSTGNITKMKDYYYSIDSGKYYEMLVSEKITNIDDIPNLTSGGPNLEKLKKMHKAIDEYEKYLADMKNIFDNYIADRKKFLANTSECSGSGAAHKQWMDTRKDENDHFEGFAYINLYKHFYKYKIAFIDEIKNDWANNQSIIEHNKKGQEKYEQDLAKYQKDKTKYDRDLAEYNKNSGKSGFEIANSQLVLNNNKIAKSVKITATDKMLVTNHMHFSKYDELEKELKPVFNGKILISDVRGDKAAKTICINAVGLSEIKKGNQKCN